MAWFHVMEHHHHYRPLPRGSFLLLLLAAGFIYKLTYDVLTKDPNNRDFTQMSYKTADSLPVVEQLKLISLAPVNIIQRIREKIVAVKQPPPPPACPIPQLDPFDKRILHLLKKTPPNWNCEAKYPLLFKSDLDSRLIPEVEAIRKEGYVSCCYKVMERVPLNSDVQTISTDCTPLSIQNATRIPDAHELIAVHCEKEAWLWNFGRNLTPVDLHAFVPPRPMSSGKKQAEQVQVVTGLKLNVVIFGIDATSRNNFHRNLPLSSAYLLEEMGAAEMVGYNKVGKNTIPNIIPLLSSKSDAEHSQCVPKCPYIWRQYSEQGYYTSYVEDVFHSFMHVRLKPAFEAHPMDHYPRPLLRWGKDFIGSYEAYDGEVACYGPRLSFRFALDYMEKYIHRMEEANKKFFQFIWASALTHDFQAAALLGDPHLLRSLKWLKGSGYLNNTLLIVMGDHGNRKKFFLGSVQGQLEERLPGMFLVFPDSFKKKYARAYRNLLGNRDKLMTTFDLHETLKDILDPDTLIQGPALDKREQQQTSLFAKSASLPRGLSLFLPIPQSRTCEMAGIEMMYCSCNYLKPIPLSSPFIPHLTKAALAHINSILKDHPQCSSPLRLHNLTMVQQTGVKHNAEYSNREAYIINFGTSPGGGEFEAYVDKRINASWAAGATVQGSMGRTNTYGPTSHCVQDPGIKPYCYCLDQNAS